MKRVHEISFLIIILIASLILRWKDVGKVPPGLEGDELSWISTSLFSGVGISPSGQGIWTLHEGNAKHFPVSVKLIRFSYHLFGVDIQSPRKILALLSVVYLLSFYFFSREFLSNRAALVVLLLHSLSTYQLLVSKIAIPSVFMGPFIFLGMLLLVKTKPFPTSSSILFPLMSGLLITLAIFTYNLAYVLPPIGILLLIVQAKKYKSSRMQAGISIIAFVLPLLITANRWIPTLIFESQTKSFSLGVSVQKLSDLAPKFHFSSLIYNFNQTSKMFLSALSYETGDMMARYPTPIIPRSITIAGMLGLVLSLVKLKKYYPLVLFFTLNFSAYHLLLGLNQPRMWLTEIALIFIFSGILADFLFSHFHKLKPHLKATGVVLFVLGLGFEINNQLRIFYGPASANPFYKPDISELYSLLRTNLPGDENLLLFTASGSKTTYRIVRSFTHLATYPKQAAKLGTMTDKDLGMFTPEETIEFQRVVRSTGSGTLILEKTEPDSTHQVLASLNLPQPGCNQNLTYESFRYFTVVKFVDCKPGTEQRII